MTKADALNYLIEWRERDKELFESGKYDAQENIEIYSIAIEALEKLSRIEDAINCCEGCECYHGIKEYPEIKAYEDIREFIYE